VAVLLHLLPGILTILFFVVAGVHLASSLGFPSRFGWLIGDALVLVPCELGLLFFLGKKRNGTFNLDGIVLYRRSLSGQELLTFVGPLLVYAAIWSQFQASMDGYFFDHFFWWLPQWFLTERTPEGFSLSVLIAMYAFSTVLVGVLGPLTEELYFHGYLLPRLSRFGVWAPVLNTVLFMGYHFHDPWRFVSRTILVFPATVVIWRKQSFRFAVWFHCIGNIVGEAIAMFAAFQRAH
jgi:membrane protease YdiL (CAAX protease family)